MHAPQIWIWTIGKYLYFSYYRSVFFCTVAGYKGFKLLFAIKYLYKQAIQCNNGVKVIPKRYWLQRIISGCVVIFSGMT